MTRPGRIPRGFSLVEVLIASAMALMVLGVIIRIFFFGRDVEREARSSYLIRQDADIAFRQIQEELRATHLASIRVADDDNGFSMVSPYQNNTLKGLEITNFGVAKWKSWVHFTVSDETENTGALIRWESPFPEDEPLGLPSSKQPSEVGSDKWSLLTGVVRPGKGAIVSSGAEKLKELGDVSDGGGLQLRFVRRVNGLDELSRFNPAQKSDLDDSSWSHGTTDLVECRLQVADVSSESGKLSLYTLNFRVAPRN